MKKNSNLKKNKIVSKMRFLLLKQIQSHKFPMAKFSWEIWAKKLLTKLRIEVGLSWMLSCDHSWVGQPTIVCKCVCVCVCVSIYGSSRHHCGRMWQLAHRSIRNCRPVQPKERLRNDDQCTDRWCTLIGLWQRRPSRPASWWQTANLYIGLISIMKAIILSYN